MGSMESPSAKNGKAVTKKCTTACTDNRATVGWRNTLVQSKDMGNLEHAPTEKVSLEIVHPASMVAGYGRRCGFSNSIRVEKAGCFRPRGAPGLTSNPRHAFGRRVKWPGGTSFLRLRPRFGGPNLANDHLVDDLGGNPTVQVDRQTKCIPLDPGQLSFDGASGRRRSWEWGDDHVVGVKRDESKLAGPLVQRPATLSVSRPATVEAGFRAIFISLLPYRG
jgi:hypothetical protein